MPSPTLLVLQNCSRVVVVLGLASLLLAFAASCGAPPTATRALANPASMPEPPAAAIPIAASPDLQATQVCLSLRELCRLLVESHGDVSLLPPEAINLASMKVTGYVVDATAGDIILTGPRCPAAPLRLPDLAHLLAMSSSPTEEYPFVSLDPLPNAMSRVSAVCSESFDPSSKTEVARMNQRLTQAISDQQIRASLPASRLRKILVDEDYFMKRVSQIGDPGLGLGSVAEIPEASEREQGSMRMNRFWFNAGEPTYRVETTSGGGSESGSAADTVILTSLPLRVSTEAQLEDSTGQLHDGGDRDKDAEEFARRYSDAIELGRMAARPQWHTFDAEYRLYAVLVILAARHDASRVGIDLAPLIRATAEDDVDRSESVPGLAHVRVTSSYVPGGVRYAVRMVAGGVSMGIEPSKAHFESSPQLFAFRETVVRSRPDNRSLTWMVGGERASVPTAYVWPMRRN